VKQRLADELREARARTETQHSPLLSPLVWDYAHIAVYQELWLVQRLAGTEPIDPARMHLYDAFEKPRGVRGGLELMTRSEVADYRDRVDARSGDLLTEVDVDGDDPLLRGGFVYQMIIQHEHQHQETLLQALQMLPGGYTPELPSRGAREGAAGPVPPGRAAMVEVPAGAFKSTARPAAPTRQRVRVPEASEIAGRERLR